MTCQIKLIFQLCSDYEIHLNHWQKKRKPSLYWSHGFIYTRSCILCTQLKMVCILCECMYLCEAQESCVRKRYKSDRVIPANLELSDVSCTILSARSKLHFVRDTLLVAREPPGISGGQVKDYFINSLLWPWQFKILINTFPTVFNFKLQS